MFARFPKVQICMPLLLTCQSSQSSQSVSQSVYGPSRAFPGKICRNVIDQCVIDTQF